jgi:hypothetical protein
MSLLDFDMKMKFEIFPVSISNIEWNHFFFIFGYFGTFNGLFIVLHTLTIHVAAIVVTYLCGIEYEILIQSKICMFPFMPSFLTADDSVVIVYGRILFFLIAIEAKVWNGNSLTRGTNWNFFNLEMELISINEPNKCVKVSSRWFQVYLSNRSGTISFSVNFFKFFFQFPHKISHSIYSTHNGGAFSIATAQLLSFNHTKFAIFRHEAIILSSNTHRVWCECENEYKKSLWWKNNSYMAIVVLALSSECVS